MQLKQRPIMLLILDGWGYSETSNSNTIAQAYTPTWDKLWQQHPHTLLSASGLDVGLPDGQMGNSEVGHLHIGAGRLAPQDLTRINLDIASGQFMTNEVLVTAIYNAVKHRSKLHLFGLLSPGGVHSHTSHFQALAKLAKQHGCENFYLHAFLDGRDTPPKSAHKPIQDMQVTFQELGCGKIASIGGRFYAMDRDKRWDRVAKAYEMLTEGKAEFHATDPASALDMAYERGETDEFVKPTCIHSEDSTPVIITDNDVIIFVNFRADRGRELSHAFTDKDFLGFKRKVLPKLADYVTMTQYSTDIAARIAYPPLDLHNVLGEVIANEGLKQLRIAETEKYAHVTFFVNGGREQPFPNEDRILVPSPKVTTYDLQPEMSLIEVTEALNAAIASEQYDFIICNFANPDMLGHTGKIKETVQAIETIDKCLAQTLTALEKVGGELVIIADHGNAEQLVNPKTGQPYTAHTCSLVPFIYVGRPAEITMSVGKLTDVAPTLFYLADIQIPTEMTGKPLVKFKQ